MKLFNIKTKNTAADLVRRSNKAVCAAMEREIRVPSEKVNETKRKLRNAGFFIIGTSEPGTKTRTIWFIRAGANL